MEFLDLYFPEWLQAEPLGGILIPEATQELTFVCDRSELAIGNYTAEIQLVGGGSVKRACPDAGRRSVVESKRDLL